jgi:lipoprotein signal peptidase
MFIIVNILLSTFWALLNSSELVASLKDKVPFLLLIESALLLLFGGLGSFSDTIFVNKVREYIYQSKEKWNGRKSLENIKKNDVYILEGVLLIVESIILGYLFG